MSSLDSGCTLNRIPICSKYIVSHIRTFHISKLPLVPWCSDMRWSITLVSPTHSIRFDFAAARLESTKTKVLLMKLKMKAEGSDAIPVVTKATSARLVL